MSAPSGAARKAAASKGRGELEVIPSIESNVDPELQELQGTARHIHTQLARFEANQDLLNKHQVDTAFLKELERLSEEDLEGKDEASLEIWKNAAEAAVDRVFPLLQEAREIHQAAKDRLHELREFHHLDEIDRLDNEVLELLPESVSVSERVNIRKKMEALRQGKEKHREYRAKDSTNAPSFRVFMTETGEVKGVAKESLREAAFAVFLKEGGKPGELEVYKQVLNTETAQFEWMVADFSDVSSDPVDIHHLKEKIAVLTSKVVEDTIKDRIAEETGLAPEQINYDATKYNARSGVLPGEGTIREWFQSRFDLLVDFKIIPLTVIRPESDASDIASVQEDVTAIEPFDPPPRQLSDPEGEYFFEQHPQWWGAVLKGEDPGNMEPDLDWASKDPARSIIRAGVMAYLMGDLDGIERNIMFHPVTGRSWKIDNGLSLGLITGQKFENITLVNKQGEPEAWSEKVASIPLEIVMKHGLSLDKEAHENIENLHRQLQNGNSKEYKCFESMFKLAFIRYGEVVANAQFNGFLDRLNRVAVTGRPEGLVKGEDYRALIENALAEAQRKADKEAANQNTIAA